MDKKIKLFHGEIEVKVLLEVLVVFALLTLILTGIYYLRPAITGLITASKEVSYSDSLGLVLNESSYYLWVLDNPGNLKSIKLNGTLENKGSAKVYIENENKRYLIFDSSKLNETQSLDEITGFVAAQDKKSGKEPNHPPVWNSDIESFIVNESIVIDLNEYFYDKDYDILTYSASELDANDLGVLLEDSALTVNNKNNIEGNRTLEITASDNETSKKKNVVFILIKNAVVNEAPINETPIINESVINETITNETAQNKAIIIDLKYNADSLYDADDNGIETTAGIVDLTAKNAKFNWHVDESKLCTRWDTYSVDNEESTTVCYGNENCCNFVGLAPTRADWNETFYSYYGLYGASFNNIISAQVVYVDYNLSIEAPRAEIIYSQWANLSASYHYPVLEFGNICVDTCALFGFNKTSYNLVFEINDTILRLSALTYTAVETIDAVRFALNVEDSEGAASGIYSLYKGSILVADEFVEPGYYNVEVIPSERVIEKLLIYNANITEPLTAVIGVDNVSREILIDGVDVKKRYAIDASALEFETASLTATATANSLFKCRQWNYSAEVCSGTWERIKDLTAGEEYELTLTADDHGFIEGDINITPVNITGLALINNISDVNIAKNNNYTIGLGNHFSNIGNNVIFTYYKPDNISIVFENSIATIVPDKDFVGAGYLFITANKDNGQVNSNIFSITVTNETVIVTPNLILKKKDFKFDEDVELDFEYLIEKGLISQGKSLEKSVKAKQKKKWEAVNETIEPFVYDSEGSLKDVDVELEELREGKFKISLPKQRAFKAGLYKIKLELVKDGITYTQEQDFTWGVLAINLNKSTYLENEDAFISLGVLDDRGKIVCDAEITLEITNPLNQKTVLTTENLDIVKHAECGFLGVTQMPDYYTYYKVGGVGTYLMNLTAVTYNGVRNIVDYIIVSEGIDFDISRKSATRIYPLAPYVMNISIIANKNYNGIINEYVPAGFDISNVEIYEVTQEEVTLLSAKDTGTGNKVLESLSEISLLAIKNIDNKNINSNQNYKPSSLINSEVGYILTRDCLLNSLSSDQIAQLSFNANAKYSASSGSGEISLASPKNSSKSSVLKNSISGASKIRNEKISSSFNPDFFIISDLCSRNSFKINSGDTRSSLLSKNKFNVLPFAIIAENSSLASTTSSIYNKPFFFNSLNLPSLSFLPNSIASFSVNLLLPARVLSATNLTNSSVTDLVTALDTSKLSSFISLSNSSGISTFSSAILSSNERYENEYLKLSNKQLKNNNQNTIINEINLNKITENIADFFTLMPSAQAQQDNIQQNNIQNNIAITTLNDTKIISIPANLKIGKKYIISYKFDAPDISPEFYVLGPLDIGTFKEARNWQIANDAPAKILDNSFSCDKTSIAVGETTACTGGYSNSGVDFAVTCTLQINNEATLALSNTCGANNLRVSAIDVSGAGLSGCSDTGFGTLSCVNWPAAADSQVIVWTIEGCAVSTANTLDTYTGCANALNNNALDIAVTAAADNTPPVVNITNLNASDSISFGKRLNISAYITGSPTLVNFTFNLTGPTNLYNFSYTVSGANVQISQNITVNLTRGNMINASVVACDSVPNCAINSTLITVANTPPPTPTILFPTNDLKTDQQPLDFNVTFAADANGDSITIYYYIDGILNQTSSTNTTFNASDGIYNLSASLYDGTDFSANASVNFTLDTAVPIINIIKVSPDPVNEDNKIEILVNVTDISIDKVLFEINNTNYSLSQLTSDVNISKNLVPNQEGIIVDSSSVGAVQNLFDQANVTYARIKTQFYNLSAKTSGISAVGVVNSVKIYVIHSVSDVDVNASVSWAVETAQGLQHNFSANLTKQTSNFSVTSERSWTLDDFNTTEIVVEKLTSGILRIHEVWFEVNYSVFGSADLWNFTLAISNLGEGNESYTVYVNDTLGNTVQQAGNITVIPKLLLVNATTGDAGDNALRADVEIYDDNNEIEFNRTNSTSHVTSVKKGLKKKVVIKPFNNVVKEIEFTDLNISETTANIVDIDDLANSNFMELYAINKSVTDYASVAITVTSKGTKLYRCTDWDFAGRICNGYWVKQRNLDYNEDYSLSESSAYAETGLVAINTHKSIYLPNEIANISIGVLDNNGVVICDAGVTLLIADPNSVLTTLTTAGGDINISNECSAKNKTYVHDYSTNYTVNGIGNYSMNATSTIPRTSLNPFMASNFEVRSNVTFDVIRSSATRILPTANYTMNFTIKANMNFTGNMTEVLEAGFDVTPQANLSVEKFENYTLLTFNVSFVNGSTNYIGYEYDAPDVSPELYLVGPLKIGNFTEARIWQIASDQVQRINATVKGILVYGENGATTPRYRIWNGTNLSGEASLPIIGPINWTVVKASSKEDEFIAVFANFSNSFSQSGSLLMSVYNGTCWGNGTDCDEALAVHLGTNANNHINISMRAFDVAYENITGPDQLAIIAYSNGSNFPVYRIWNSSSRRLSNVNAISNTYRNGGRIGWIDLVEMASNTNGANEIALLMRHEGGDDLSAIIWNATNSTWGCNKTLSINLDSLNEYKDFGAAYRKGNSQLFVAMSVAATAAITTANKTLGACDWKVSGNFVTTDIPTIMDVNVDEVSGNNTCVSLQSASEGDNNNYAFLIDGRTAASAVDAISQTAPGPPKQYIACGGFGNGSLAIYGSVAAPTTLDHYLYNLKSNTWNAGVAASYTPSPTPGVKWNVIFRQFPEEADVSNKTFIFFSDANADLSLQLFDASKGVLSNTYSNLFGGFIETTLSGAATMPFDFAFRRFYAPAAVVLDTTKPRINASLNNLSSDFLQGNRVNMTANVTDETGLSGCQFIDNQSLANGAKTYFNFSFNGGVTSSMCSQNYTIRLSAGNVINFTVIVNDTSTAVAGGNINQSEYAGGVIGQIITVIAPPADETPPVVNTTFNVTSPVVNDVINFTGNVTDETNLLSANWTFNLSGSITKMNYTLSGTTAQVSNTTQLSCVETCVVNFTLYVTDTSNNVKQNSTLIKVADVTKPVVNTTFNVSNAKVNDVINFTGNITDLGGLISANVTYNLSGVITYANYTLSGTTAQVSNFTTLSCTETCVINFTMYATDTSNNVKQNSTLIKVADVTKPVVNTTFNTTSPRNIDVINMTGNVTDGVGLLSANWTINFSTGKVFANYTLSGTTAQVSNVTSLYGLAGGTVLNFTLYATDTSNNVKQNSTVFTIADVIFPVVNTTFNVTNAKVTDIVNYTANITDETGLLSANWTVNLSTGKVFANYTLSGTTAQISNTTSLSSCTEACVLNFTIYATDTSNNVKQNSTLLTVADITPPVVNTSLNKSLTNILENDIINLTANTTDGVQLSFGQIIVNASPAGQQLIRYFNFSLNGNKAEFSQNITINCPAGCVINFTARVNDSANNFRTNDTIITVAAIPDIIPPGVNITNINESASIRINDVLNISCQAFDSPTKGNITFNLTGNSDLYNFSFALTGASANFSQNITMNVTRGNVINATCWAYDSNGNGAQNSTLITIANRAPTQANIVNASNQYYNLNKTFNITPSTDADLDTLTYFWFLNSSTDSYPNLVKTGVGTTNWTTNTTDTKVYYLFVNVSDGVVNVTGNLFNWTYDVIVPVVNTTLNKSITNIVYGDIINITANVTDETGLSFCQIIINQSGPTALEIINISLSGKTAQCSNASKVTLSAGGVINYTIRANDTSNNWKTNDTIITVKDITPPTITLDQPVNNTNTSLTNISFRFTATDGSGLKNATLFANFSGLFIANQSNQTGLVSGQQATIFVNETITEGLFVWNIFACDDAGTPNCGFASANFTLRVDRTPPAFSNIKSNISYYQFYTTQFNTTWTDNNALFGYIFSINRSGTWFNTTLIRVDDVSSANSTNVTIINDTPGTVLGWQFYANDSAGNLNYTPVQTFMVGGITWNLSILNIGTTTQNSANITSSTAIIGYLNNSNVSIGCISGNCSIITTNYTVRDVNDTTNIVYFNCSTITAGSFEANYSINSTEDYFNSNLTVRCAVQTIVYFLSPENAEKVDRDRVDATDADNATLLVRLSNSSAGINVTFKMNLTKPIIEGQSNILVGNATTDAFGNANTSWNGSDIDGDKMFAGNYTWWVEVNGAQNDTPRYIYLFGSLNLSFRFANLNPNSTYEQGELVKLEMLLKSKGPESPTQINSTYLAKVNATLTDPTSTNFTVELFDPEVRDSKTDVSGTFVEETDRKQKSILGYFTDWIYKAFR